MVGGSNNNLSRQLPFPGVATRKDGGKQIAVTTAKKAAIETGKAGGKAAMAAAAPSAVTVATAGGAAAAGGLAILATGGAAAPIVIGGAVAVMLKKMTSAAVTAAISNHAWNLQVVHNQISPVWYPDTKDFGAIILIKKFNQGGTKDFFTRAREFWARGSNFFTGIEVGIVLDDERYAVLRKGGITTESIPTSQPYLVFRPESETWAREIVAFAFACEAETISGFGGLTCRHVCHVLTQSLSQNDTGVPKPILDVSRAGKDQPDRFEEMLWTSGIFTFLGRGAHAAHAGVPENLHLLVFGRAAGDNADYELKEAFKPASASASGSGAASSSASSSGAGSSSGGASSSQTGDASASASGSGYGGSSSSGS